MIDFLLKTRNCAFEVWLCVILCRELHAKSRASSVKLMTWHLFWSKQCQALSFTPILTCRGRDVVGLLPAYLLLLLKKRLHVLFQVMCMLIPTLLIIICQFAYKPHKLVNFVHLLRFSLYLS